MSWNFDGFPPQRKVVLVWIRGSALPFCAYMKYAAGDEDCPYWVVYHGNSDRGSDVTAWCDCLPDAPPGVDSVNYDRGRHPNKPLDT